VESSWSERFFLLSDIVRIWFFVRGYVDAQFADDGSLYAANACDVDYWQVLAAKSERSHAIVGLPYI